MTGQVNAVSSGDRANVPQYVDANYAEYLPKDAMAQARLLGIFNINGDRIIDDNEAKGLEKVLKSNGYEMWDVYNEEGRRVAYVWDTTQPGKVSQWYEYAQINEKNQRDYYTRVNILTGDETFIRYHYDEKGEWEERYHNQNIEERIEVEYTGPNNDLTKKRTEVKALYKQLDEFQLDENGEIIFDEETGEPKRKEELIGYQTVITEFEYDENFKLVGVPKETRKTTLIQNKQKKSLNIKG